jgi:hypothetical protein
MFFFAWWRGRGISVLLISVVVAVMGAALQQALLGWSDPPYGLAVGLGLAALPVHFYVLHLQRNAGVRFDSKRQGVFQRQIRDSLFSLNVKLWPRLLLGFGWLSGFLMWIGSR